LEPLVEPEEKEEPQSQKPTTTPPSTPVRSEEGRLAWHNWHDRCGPVLLGSAWVPPVLLGFGGFSRVYGGDAEAPPSPLACLSWGLFVLWSLILLLQVLCCVFCNNRPRGFDYLTRFILFERWTNYCNSVSRHNVRKSF